MVIDDYGRAIQAFTRLRPNGSRLVFTPGKTVGNISGKVAMYDISPMGAFRDGRTLVKPANSSY
jgi:hypothetical protein